MAGILSGALAVWGTPLTVTERLTRSNKAMHKINAHVCVGEDLEMIVLWYFKNILVFGKKLHHNHNRDKL